MKKYFTALAVSLIVGVALAGTSTWVNGSTAGWNSESSWKGGVPGSGDMVEVPAGTDLPVGDDDVGLAGTVAAVDLKGSDSTITFNLSQGIECTMVGSITGNGMIVKDGAGVVRFTATPKDSYYAKGGIRVLAGEAYYPQTFGASYSGEYMNIGPVYVAAGATLHPYACYRVTVMDGLTGDGTVNNGVGGGAWPIRIDSAKYSAFGGKIHGNVKVQVNAPFDLLNDGCNYLGDTSLYNTRADLGVMKFGKDNPDSIYGVSSSLGRTRYSATTFNTLNFGVNGVRVRFLGEQETTDRRFSLDGSGTIDAGAGQLSLTGKVSANGAKQYALTLAGSNTVAASVLDADWDEGADNSIYLAKKGTGVWLIPGSDRRQNKGVVAVEEGTLRIDSLAEAGTPCSLGLSTCLAQKYSGAWDASKVADYAVLLGSADAEGTLEYVGTTFYDNAVSTRPIAVTGKGGRIVASVPNRMTGFKGAFAADADGATLTLDGNGTTNYFYDISDRHGPLSVAKEGTGTWILGGDQTFSGRLDVKAGELVVSSTLGKAYEWYRFTIRQTISAVKNSKTASFSDDTAQVRIHDVAIYDADGNRLNRSYVAAPDNTVPATGEVTSWNSNFRLGEYYKDKYGADNYGRLTDEKCDWYLFLTGVVWVDGKRYPPFWDWPETWIPFVFHMKDGAAKAAAYDFVSTDGPAYNWEPIGFTMEASADGVFWDLVSSVQSNAVQYAGKTWVSDGSAFTANAIRKDKGFAFGLDNDKSLLKTDPVQAFGAGGVSVASGAVLRAEGNVRIPALEIDVNGAGTIRGFTMAEEGTVNIVGLEKLENAIELPLGIEQASGTDRFAEGWSVTVNGNRKAACLTYRDGKLTAIPLGMAIIIR